VCISAGAIFVQRLRTANVAMSAATAAVAVLLSWCEQWRQSLLKSNGQSQWGVVCGGAVPVSQLRSWGSAESFPSRVRAQS